MFYAVQLCAYKKQGITHITYLSTAVHHILLNCLCINSILLPLHVQLNPLDKYLCIHNKCDKNYLLPIYNVKN